MAHTRLRLRRLAYVLTALLTVQGGVSLLLLMRPVSASLRARLERALGRPVEVGYFGVSVWSGLRLEAHYITVGEDPRFGNEFVLRADRLSAAPRWPALLRGRLEFSRYSFDRPSLNLVRTADAHWNFEGWSAPPRGFAAGDAPSPSATAVAISISNGRINFKRSADKLPFALAGVNGQISPSPDGRWTLNFQAQPLRAGVTLQDAGTIHFAGTFPIVAFSPAAVSSATPPIDFSLEWDGVSLPDALRLIAGYDFGVRGSLEGLLTGQFRGAERASGSSSAESALSPEQRSAAPAWKISARVRLADVHRWDLPLQAGQPAVNFSLVAAGSADRREWALRDIVLEARRSRVGGAGELWLGENARGSLRLISGGIHLDDLLAWYRAFHPGVRPGTSWEGYLGADVALEGWPLRIVHATLATSGARLNIPGENRPIEIRRAVLEADAGGGRLVDTQLDGGAGDSGIRLAGHAAWTAGIPFDLELTGGTAHLAEFSAAAAALGLSSGSNPLRAEGTASAKLAWKGAARPWRVETTGTVALQNVTFSGGLLRGPIAVGRARVDFRSGRRHLEIAAVKAFGAVWSGTLGAATLAGPWDFALSADRLNPALVIRGFSNQPPDDSSLLSRILPAQAAATLALESPRWPNWLRGDGSLLVNSLEVGRLELAQLKGHLSIGERQITLEDAAASAYGGRVHGEARATFSEQPRYTVRVDFDGLNVAPLAALAVSTHGCCAGNAAGRLQLSAAGWTRDALLASLTGAGRAEVRSGALLTLDLPGSISVRELRPGRTTISSGSGDFTVSNGRILLHSLALDLPGRALEGKGTVSNRGELDIAISAGDVHPDGAKPSGSLRAVQVTGTLAAPQIVAAPQP